MAKADQTTRAMIIAGYIEAVTGDAYSVTVACPVCMDPMTWDSLSTPDVAGITLGHDDPREGDAGTWTWDVCYPICCDCNQAANAAGNQRQGREDVADATIRTILSSDYRTNRTTATNVINRNKAVIQGRKDAKAAKRAAQGKGY